MSTTNAATVNQPVSVTAVNAAANAATTNVAAATVVEAASEHRATSNNAHPVNVVAHQANNNNFGSQYNSMVVPVMLHHRDSVNKVMVYALLDDQSNSTFVSEQTLSKIGVSGQSVNIKLGTMLSEQIVSSEIIHDLYVTPVCGNDNSICIPLPGTYLRNSVPVDKGLIPCPETALQWDHLGDITDQLLPLNKDLDVGLLIGLDCPKAIKPREIIAGKGDEPWAVRTHLGWGVCGIVNPEHRFLQSVTDDEPCHVVFRTHVTPLNPLAVHQMFDRDFNDPVSDEKISMQDKRFIDIVDREIRQQQDSHFELPLPFKCNEMKLPDNLSLASCRLHSLKRKLLKDQQYRTDYLRFMTDLIDKGYAEPVHENEKEERKGVWYLPHHGVYNPQKPGKIRVVFDCSADYRGHVLNEYLLQGPDMTNNLAGVLCRFRRENVAVSCDIESMFHQVRVREEDRDFLRFLWWENCDLDSPPRTYRMTVHLFGAKSSPGCVNYALKRTADKYEDDVSKAAADFIRDDFYVDDGLTSVATTREAICLINESHELCAKAGFNLHKYVCNDKAVVAAIPAALRAKDIQNIDLSREPLPVERTLGVQWCIESDCFQFRCEVKNRPFTRRGILSTVSSIFDPLGLVSPFVLKGKQILQRLVREGGDWDDDIPEEIKVEWEKWCTMLPDLVNLKIPRCYKPKDFGAPTIVEIHHFADASSTGYGQCSYLRQINIKGEISCSLICGKARVTPSKPVTIPRLELTAAVISVKTSDFLKQQLKYNSATHYYWTDSKVVLGYVNNESKQFHVFVANRVQQIRDRSEVSQWNHVKTKENPADLASRGSTAQELISSQYWWNGPEFLWSSEPIPVHHDHLVLQPDDPGVKRVSTHKTEAATHFSTVLERVDRFSSWHRAKHAFALCLRYIHILKLKVRKEKTTEVTSTSVKQLKRPTVMELQEAETVIIRAAQFEAFKRERLVLEQGASYTRQRCRQRNLLMKKDSSLYRLDPYLDTKGIIRVGGRIRRANLPNELAHPVVLPKNGHVTELIIRHYHEYACHAGCNTTLNEIRASGFWILRARSMLNKLVRKCVKCLKLHGGSVTQKMADLPEDRLAVAPPFTYSGVDFFGPFYVKEGRSEKKRYGVIFTCMASRAVHLETANNLTTDAFINAYRRFVCRRGPVRQLRCDCGTNFTGAKAELAAAKSEMDSHKISSQLLKDNCDWVEFKMNPPHASRMGGVWERLIRSVRKLLSSLLDNHGTKMDDEQLRTLMVEAESIVNSRPITYVDMNSPESSALSPSQILTLKSSVVLPPPGVFQREDIYCRKRWRIVQYLANQFWSKWKMEYLSLLQERSKWNKVQPNLCEGDIVLVKEENSARCDWSLGRIDTAIQSDDGLVRKVKVTTNKGVYDRPVHKLVLIYSPGIPDEEPE